MRYEFYFFDYQIYNVGTIITDQILFTLKINL